MTGNRRNDGRGSDQVYHDNGGGYENDQRYSSGRHQAIGGSSRPVGRGVDGTGLGVGVGTSMRDPPERSTPGYDGQPRNDERSTAPAIGPEREGLQLGMFSPIEGCWLLIDRARKTNLPEVGEVLLLLVYPSSGCDVIFNAVLRSLISRAVLTPAGSVVYSHRCALVAGRYEREFNRGSRRFPRTIHV